MGRKVASQAPKPVLQSAPPHNMFAAPVNQTTKRIAIVVGMPVTSRPWIRGASSTVLSYHLAVNVATSALGLQMFKARVAKLVVGRAIPVIQTIFAISKAVAKYVRKNMNGSILKGKVCVKKHISMPDVKNATA